MASGPAITISDAPASRVLLSDFPAGRVLVSDTPASRIVCTDEPSEPELTPASLSGLALWLGARFITGLNDGDVVTTWTDQSGNGRDATQATASKKPLYKTGIVNSLPVIRFDGSNDELGVASFGGTSITIFLVARVALNEPAGRGFLSRASYVSWFARRSAAIANQQVFSWADLNQRGFSGGTLADGTFHVLTYRYDENGTQPKAVIHTDGVLAGADTGQSGPLDTVANAWAIGKESVAGFFHNDDIAEVVIYTTALTDAEVEQVEGYLGTKYGISV